MLTAPGALEALKQKIKNDMQMRSNDLKATIENRVIADAFVAPARKHSKHCKWCWLESSGYQYYGRGGANTYCGHVLMMKEPNPVPHHCDWYLVEPNGAVYKGLQGKGTFNSHTSYALAKRRGGDATNKE